MNLCKLVYTLLLPTIALCTCALVLLRDNTWIAGVFYSDVSLPSPISEISVARTIWINATPTGVSAIDEVDVVDDLDIIEPTVDAAAMGINATPTTTTPWCASTHYYDAASDVISSWTLFQQSCRAFMSSWSLVPLVDTIAALVAALVRKFIQAYKKQVTLHEERVLQHVLAEYKEGLRILKLLYDKSKSREERTKISKAIKVLQRLHNKSQSDPTTVRMLYEPHVIEFIQALKEEEALEQLTAHRNETSRILQLVFDKSTTSDKERLEIDKALQALVCWYCKALEDPTTAGMCDDPIVNKFIQAYNLQQAVESSIDRLV